MFLSIFHDRALRTAPLMGLGLWLAPWANAQDRGMVRTSSSVPDEPTTYVLAVGVADFKHLAPDFDLRYSEADASAFAEGLVSALGESLPQDQVTVLVGRAATLETVSVALRETLAAADENDTVILFFSTHGVLSGDEGYLLTWDTTPNERLPYTSLPTKDIVSAVNRSRAAHVLLFTDACHAGITGAGTKGASVPSFDPSKIQVDHRSFFNQASSTIMQPSLEGPEYCGGHGAYTCALLRAMHGEVDQDSDGVVSLRELQIYVPPLVDSLTNGQQSPETKGRYDSQHVFVRVLPTPGQEKGGEELGILFADVAPEEIGVMEAYEDEAAAARIPVVESDDALGGDESPNAEIAISNGGSVSSKEYTQRPLVPVVVGDELLIPHVDLQQNQYSAVESDDTLFVAHPELLPSSPETEETPNVGRPAPDEEQVSSPIRILQFDERVPQAANASALNLELLERKHLRTKLALFGVPLTVGVSLKYFSGNSLSIDEPIAWVSSATFVTLTEYSAIMGLRTCLLIVDEWPQPRNDRARLRCQLGVTTVAIGTAGSAMSLMTGGSLIMDEFSTGNDPNYLEYAIYMGIGAASLLSASTLLSM